jgi:hypothetical protein
MTSVGKWIKNTVARQSMDHFIEFVPKLGERVRLRFSDGDVMRVNDQLKAAGVAQCEGDARVADGSEFVQLAGPLKVVSHAG